MGNCCIVYNLDVYSTSLFVFPRLNYFNLLVFSAISLLCLNCCVYGLILLCIRADTVVYTGWYCCVYGLILLCIRADTVVFCWWYWFFVFVSIILLCVVTFCDNIVMCCDVILLCAVWWYCFVLCDYIVVCCVMILLCVV